MFFLKADGVAKNGWLSIEEGKLVNDKGKPVQLRGMSSHGLMWYPEYSNYRSLKTLNSYGANVFRIAMYSDQDSGYIYNPEHTRKILYTAIENTLEADMYAIIDWHTLEDNDPNIHIDIAAEFFDEISKRYKDEPGVIYEIFNEMSGDTDWHTAKRYAEVIIPIIRKNSPHSIILVGTPKYSTDIKSAMKDPLQYKNIMYTYHFYTGMSDDGYKYNLESAMKNDFPIFVSEWGINLEKGEEDKNLYKAKSFLEFLNENNISWINWSLSNKAESYSFIKDDVNKLSDWNKEDLTLSGRLIKEYLSK